MAQIRHKTNVGSVILGLLNGLKHTPQTIGPLLGIAPEELEKIIRGEIKLAKGIEDALISITGMNQKDFYPAEFHYLFPVMDDTSEGVTICRNQDTVKSQRMLTRGPQEAPYYIYADMAMSNLSTFRPEWIKQLHVHDGKNAEDLPDWAFNRGHFEHQVTYFMGPVNFYWKDREDKRYVRKMNTGDTNYITPFVPHTFTTRKKGEGLILAVTYGGAIADPEFRLNLSALDPKEFLRNVPTRLPVLSSETLGEIQGGVVICEYFDAQRDTKNVIKLIHPRCQPDTKVQIFNISGGERIGVRREKVFSDRWGYNIGNSSVVLSWDRKNESLLKPGDSFFIKPEVWHVFIGTRNEWGELLVVDIKPEQGDPYTELALIDKYAGEMGLRRVHTETIRWY